MGALKIFVSWLALLLHCAPLVLGRAIPPNDTMTSLVPKPGEIFTKNRATIDYNDCDSDETDVLGRALSAVGPMLEVALERLAVLKNLIAQEPKKPSDTTAEAIVAWHTFSSLFGDPYYGPGAPYNSKGLEEVEEVEEYITNMHGAIMNPNGPKLEIWCDDNFYKTKDGNGQDLPSGTYYDDRPATDGGTELIYMPPDVLCRAGQSLARVVAPWSLKQPYGEDVTLIIFCKETIKTRRSDWWSKPVETLRDNFDLDKWGVHLDDINKENAIMVTLHELGHCENLVYPKPILGDTTVTLYGKEEDALTFMAAVVLASSNRQDARGNTENYAYFVTAMYFRQWDWSMGYAEDLPSTADTEPDFV